MAFCSRCGADLNGSNVCTACGAKAGANIYQQDTEIFMGADIRQRSLAEFDRMIAYFSEKAKQYEDFEAFSSEIEKRTSTKHSGWVSAAVIALLIGLFTKAGFFYIAAVGFVAMFILLKMDNKKKLAIAISRRDKVGEMLSKHYNNYGYCAVGIEYTYPSKLMELRDLIREGRANTPAEAINISLADEAQAEIQRLHEEVAAAAKEAAKRK